MSNQYLVSQTDYDRIQKMLRAFEQNTLKLQPRRRNISVGGAGSSGVIRIARIAENATANDHIKASLWDASTGVVATEGDEFEVELWALMLGSSRLDMVAERLTIGDPVPVFQAYYDNNGTPELRWYINNVFTAGEEWYGYDN